MGQGRRTGLRRTATAGLLVSALAVCAPATAQEAGGALFTFGISTTLRTSDNLSLDPNPAGTSTVSETRLTFGFESVTRTQELYISFSDTLEFGWGPDAPADAGFKSPEAELDYLWRGKNSELTFSLDLTVDDLDDDATNLDEEDPSSLVLGTGDLTTRILNFNFETGINDPFGTELRLSETDIDYSDNTPDLIDSTTQRAVLTAFFRPNQTIETNLSYSHTIYDGEDANGTERVTRVLSFGAAQALDPVTTISGSIGWAHIAETWTAVPLDRPDIEGAIASFVFARDLPAGGFQFEIDYRLTRLGHRTDVLVTRDFELRTGALNFMFGATHIEGGSTQAVGQVGYLREWTDRTFRFDLSSTIAIEENTSVRRKTQATLGYLIQINEIESLDFGLSVGGITEGGSGGVRDRTRVTASATYRRDLTRDWALETGYIYRVRDIEGVGTSYANEIFVTLGREFAWRP